MTHLLTKMLEELQRRNYSRHPNHRLVAFERDQVTFRWKDYAHGNKMAFSFQFSASGADSLLKNARGECRACSDAIHSWRSTAKSQATYCPVRVAAVFSGTGAAFSGAAAVPSLVRNGRKGVTSKGIFSAAVVMATGLVLINSS